MEWLLSSSSFDFNAEPKYFKKRTDKACQGHDELGLACMVLLDCSFCEGGGVGRVHLDIHSLLACADVRAGGNLLDQVPIVRVTSDAGPVNGSSPEPDKKKAASPAWSQGLILSYDLAPEPGAHFTKLASKQMHHARAFKL